MSSLLADEHSTQRPREPEPRCPIDTFQLRRNIAGVDTELLVQTFDDRILVLITQNGKVGPLASLPPVVELQPPPSEETPTGLSALPPPPSSIHLTPLLGSPVDTALHDLYVSQIATLIWWSLQLSHATRRNVIVGLTLAKRKVEAVDEAERERFGGIANMVAAWPGPK
ncbi:hypothetical protein A1Q2_06434 [Trichosporon asahii var. asahii CBS 8904]|uniref:Proteasome assembly chaperone 3 n=1 Tax=Trichosporon asahii var. asahii (strain CBS 8904) TaxID=1220162 RepID=K1V5J2_TRIAC|nr:hypothetical protein A1Q2_06434 [Trichosporon asahii var. asahii CBS 8904]